MNAQMKLLYTGVAFLGIGFIATAAGSIWVIFSPIDGGVNFGAGAMWELGMLVGVVGLALCSAAGISLRRQHAKHRPDRQL